MYVILIVLNMIPKGYINTSQISQTSYDGCNTYQLYYLGDIPAEAARSMSVLVHLFPHQRQSGISTWVEPDSQTAIQPSDLSLSMRMVGTAA
jgi:hypothetical protein